MSPQVQHCKCRRGSHCAGANDCAMSAPVSKTASRRCSQRAAHANQREQAGGYPAELQRRPLQPERERCPEADHAGKQQELDGHSLAQGSVLAHQMPHRQQQSSIAEIGGRWHHRQRPCQPKAQYQHQCRRKTEDGPPAPKLGHPAANHTGQQDAARHHAEHLPLAVGGCQVDGQRNQLLRHGGAQAHGEARQCQLNEAGGRGCQHQGEHQRRQRSQDE